MIVTDEEIAAHHFGRFGPDADPREIVDEGVFKAALGYSSGSTVTTILLRHGLVARSDATRLTAKGKRYARELFKGISCREVVGIARCSANASETDE